MKTIMFIVWRSLQQHRVSTLVTVMSIALACGLLMAVFVIQTQTYLATKAGATRFDAVLGARGSQLQLVLNAVFHLDVSPGNIPYAMYTAIKKDPRVSAAIPYALGDNFQGYRIVATSLDFFNFKGSRANLELETGGRYFNESQREAVIGSFVAQKTGLTVGSVFNAYHGVVYDETMKHPEQFTVVGILKPTNTPTDRAIWTSLEAFYRISGHVLRGEGKEYIPQQGIPINDDAKEISAVMIKFKTPQGGINLDQTINRQGKVATLAWPIDRVMVDFFNKMGWFHKILTIMAYVIAVIACGSILSGIYNSMNERRRQFALFRVLGARRRTVFSIILTEAIFIAFIGALVGFMVYMGIMAIAGVLIRTGTGVVIDPFLFHPIFILAPLGITVLGALAGLIPAIKAYQVQVVKHIVPQS